MPDMIPAAKIAAVALRHVEAAKEDAKEGAYGSSAAGRVHDHLAVAAELLALLADPPQPTLRVSVPTVSVAPHLPAEMLTSGPVLTPDLGRPAYPGNTGSPPPAATGKVSM